VIPNHNQSGVLPPFLPDSDPTKKDAQSPYQVSILEFIQRYATSPERIVILNGFVSYREELRKVGITKGFQWINGSFVEDIEKNSGRPPNDVDIVTFFYKPDIINKDQWGNLIESRQDLLIHFVVKRNIVVMRT
jgi:hypothetical protein